MLRSADTRFPLSALLSLLGLIVLLGLHWQPTAAEALPGDPAVAIQISVEQALFELTNADRAAHGLQPLSFDPDLLPIARRRAFSQLGTQPLSHYDADGDLAFVHLLADARIGYDLAGENLARASANDPTVTERVEQALMQSPTHRKNILEHSFSRAAIGMATNGSGQVTFAEIYRD